ncbi:MAG TPA: DUF1559 domain-containing protein, partial [Gemmataceae bacterium]
TNMVTISQPVKVYACPAAPERPAYTITLNFGTTIGPYTAFAADYSPVAYVDFTEATVNLGIPYLPNQALLGVMQPDKRTKITEITDGTSNTILVTELAGKPTLYLGGFKNSGTQLNIFTGANNPPGPVGGAGGWGDATSGGSVLMGSNAAGTTNRGPCLINCSNDYGLYGFHSGGINAAYCDGSVHFVGADIAPSIIVALITSNGGEINTNVD